MGGSRRRFSFSFGLGLSIFSMGAELGTAVRSVVLFGSSLGSVYRSGGKGDYFSPLKRFVGLSVMFVGGGALGVGKCVTSESVPRDGFDFSCVLGGGSLVS